jgi:hypothetical protein
MLAAKSARIVPAAALALEHLHHDRSRHHEVHQVLEEGPLAVHGVEAFRLGPRQPHHPRRNHLQAVGLEARIDLPDDVFRDCVGLDDRQGSFHRHDFNLCFLDELPAGDDRQCLRGARAERKIFDK